MNEAAPIVERAKEYLMTKHQFNENQAHRFLQQASMAIGVKKIEIARQIIEKVAE